MTKREKLLSGVVGGTLFLLINFYAVRFLLENKRKLDLDRKGIENEMQMLAQQESEREMWSQRDAWLNDSLQSMGDQDVANRKLIESIQEIAKKHTVTLEAPQPGVPLKQPMYTTLSIKLEAKAEWKQMFDFLQEIQAPGQFVSIDGSLKVDPADKTQLRVSPLSISKWFQPEVRR